MAYTHAAYAVATSADIVDVPVFMGKRWGVGYMWTEAVVYAAVSLALGYAGWITKPQEQPHTSTVSTGDRYDAQTVVQPDQPISR